MKNRIKNHKDKLDKIDKIEKLQKKGEDLNKEQKEQSKKKDEISIRLSEVELILGTLSTKLDEKAVESDKRVSVEESKKEVSIPVVEKVELEVVREVANVDLAVLCCTLKVVHWDKCDSVKSKLSEYGVQTYDKLHDLKEATLRPANIVVLCGEISESGHYKGVKTAELLRQVKVLLTLDFEAVLLAMKPKEVEPKPTAVKPVAAVEKVKQVETKPAEKDEFDDDDEFVEVKTKKREGGDGKPRGGGRGKKR